MLSSTYNLLKDPKLLLAILDNINLAYIHALSGFLAHERLFKRIPHYNNTPESELNFFKLKVHTKYGFDKCYIETMDRLNDILATHKDAPIEFSRDKNFVIASINYDLKKISPDDLKKDIKTCKDFIREVQEKIKQ
jgi:hypothetical protein